MLSSLSLLVNMWHLDILDAVHAFFEWLGFPPEEAKQRLESFSRLGSLLMAINIVKFTSHWFLLSCSHNTEFQYFEGVNSRLSALLGRSSPATKPNLQLQFEILTRLVWYVCSVTIGDQQEMDAVQSSLLKLPQETGIQHCENRITSLIYWWSSFWGKITVGWISWFLLLPRKTLFLKRIPNSASLCLVENPLAQNKDPWTASRLSKTPHVFTRSNKPETTSVSYSQMCPNIATQLSFWQVLDTFCKLLNFIHVSNAEGFKSKFKCNRILEYLLYVKS